MAGYSLDTQAAKKADQRGGFIKEIGAYVGVFTRAEEVTAQTGTKGVAFTFKSDDGQQCDFTLYTVMPDDTELRGYAQINALMACLSLRSIEPRTGKVRRWDSQSKQEYEDSATLFPDLMGKEIGVMLETRDYERRDGQTGTAIELAAFFRAADQFMASEILSRATEPAQYVKVLAGLRHRPLKGSARKDATTRSYAPSGGGFNDMDDDIPFSPPYRGLMLHSV